MYHILKFVPENSMNCSSSNNHAISHQQRERRETELFHWPYWDISNLWLIFSLNQIQGTFGPPDVVTLQTHINPSKHKQKPGMMGAAIHQHLRGQSFPNPCLKVFLFQLVVIRTWWPISSAWVCCLPPPFVLCLLSCNVSCKTHRGFSKTKYGPLPECGSPPLI